MASIFLHSVYGDLGRPNLRGMFEHLASIDVEKQHTLAETADDADFVLITEAQCHQDNALFSTINSSPFVRKWRRKAFVYCDTPNPPFVLPGLYTNVTPVTIDPTRQQGSCYFGRNDFEDDPLFVDTVPELLYSFSGSFWTHPVRPRLAKLKHMRGDVVEVSGVSWYGENTDAKKHLRDRFRLQMARTKFPLCPRGVGVNSFRLFEVMSAGRVPVIISDAWVPPPGPDWDACTIRVRESDVARLPEILEAEEDSYQMRVTAVRDAYARYFALPRQWHYLGDSLVRLSGSMQNERPREVRHFLALTNSVRFRMVNSAYDHLRAMKNTLLPCCGHSGERS